MIMGTVACDEVCCLSVTTNSDLKNDTMHEPRGALSSEGHSGELVHEDPSANNDDGSQGAHFTRISACAS